MSEHIYIEVETEEIRKIVVDKIREHIGKGISVIGIYQTKEELIESETEEQ